MSMPSLSFVERRRSPRVLRLRKARCVFNDGTPSLDVTLRNISFTGRKYRFVYRCKYRC